MSSILKEDFVIDGVLLRECPKCKIAKPLNKENFRKKKNNIGGFAYDCKECTPKSPKGQKDNSRALPREEILARDELNEYVRKTFFKYEEGVPVPRYFWNRVNGMITGTFCGGERTLKDFKYTYRLMLYTFKYSESSILRCIDSMSFNDDAHFINVICKIAEKNIMNGLYRLKDDIEIQNRVEEEMSKAEESDCQSEGATYVKKTNLKKGNSHLW